MTRRALAHVAALAASVLVGCATSPFAFEWPVAPEPVPERPPIVESPAADLPAPGGLRAYSGAYRRIPLQWDPILDLEIGGYLVEVAEQRDGPFTRLTPVWGRGRLALVAGEDLAPLGDGETRFYRIRAFTPDGHLASRASTVVVATTAPLPDAPRGLRAYSRQPREVPLAWRVSDEDAASGYVLERSPGADGPWEVVAELDDRHQASFVDEGLEDLRVFYYRVSARNPDGARGPASEPVRAVTKPKPLPPLGLRLAEQQLGVNVLAWEPNVEPDIAEYRLYREGLGDERSLVARVPGDAEQLADAAVGAGESIAYSLVAVDRAGLESRPSEIVVAEGLGYELVAGAEPDGIHLRWNPRTDEGYVRARIEREGWLGREILGTTGDGLFVDQDVEAGVAYRYVAVLERADASEAPPSRPIEIQMPEALAVR